MSTDFNYGNKTVNAGGPIKPSGKDMPGDPRTRIKTYSEKEIIPNPFVGMVVTVLADENNNGEMRDYKVKSLKANSAGIPNMVIDKMIPYADYLGVSSSGGGTGTGLTSEQAQQLQTAYEHSQSDHVTMDEVNVAISNAQLGGGEVDTSTFQLKTDETLETTDKTVVGAINELNNDLGGKSFIYLTQAEFDALESKNENVVYGITDGTEATSPSIDDVAAEINKLSLNISGSTLSLKYNGTTLSTITLPTSSGGGAEVTETFGNIVLSKTVDSVTEGNEITFTVKLDAAPTNSQVVSLSADNLYVMLDKDSLTFTPADYSTPQTVKVNAMSVDSTQTSTITVSSPNVSSKTLVITVNDSTPSSGGGETNTLTRDGLVYYLDFKDQNYTANSSSEYITISDTNTLYSEELIIINMNNTNNNYEGNVIEGNILKSGELPSKRYPKIKGIDGLVTDIFTNKNFTFETYAQFNAKPVDNHTILFNTGTLLFRGNIGKDIGLYITTESNGAYGYFNFDSTSIDYTQPHLYTVTIDQSVSGSITYSMYVDGELNQNGTKTGTIKTVTTPYLHILEDNDRNKEYASFRVYNKVLTADEVLANYQYEQTIERIW